MELDSRLKLCTSSPGQITKHINKLIGYIIGNQYIHVDKVITQLRIYLYVTNNYLILIERPFDASIDLFMLYP